MSEQRIVDLYKKHGTLDAVFERVDLPRADITAIVDSIPNREAYRRRGTFARTSRETVIEHLRQAAALMGEPLTAPNYRAASKQLGLVAYNTILSHFDSLPEACAAAGIRFNVPKREYSRVSREECVRAVADCIRELGSRPSYPVYTMWARDNRRVSASTVKLRVGWNTAVEAALALTTA